MPEVLGDPPSPRTALFWNGTAWQWALVDAAGHLQLDVVTSGLPGGAATAANQAAIIAAMLNRATTPAVYNVTMTLAATEYNQALPANTKKFLIKCRTDYAIQVCFVALGSGTLFVTVPPGMTYWEDLIQPATLTLYFQCAVAAQVAEIVAWS